MYVAASSHARGEFCRQGHSFTAASGRPSLPSPAAVMKLPLRRWHPFRLPTLRTAPAGRLVPSELRSHCASGADASGRHQWRHLRPSRYRCRSRRRPPRIAGTCRCRWRHLRRDRPGQSSSAWCRSTASLCPGHGLGRGPSPYCDADSRTTAHAPSEPRREEAEREEYETSRWEMAHGRSRAILVHGETG